MTVLFIILLHAIPVLVVAVWTESKIALTIAAIIAGIIGVVSGNPAYMAGDLIGVVIAFGLGIFFINSQKPFVAPQIKKLPPAPEKKEEDSSWIGGIVGLVIVVTFLYNKATDKPASSRPPVQVPQQAYVPLKPQQSPRSERPADTRKTSTANGNRGNSDLRHCLNLPTDTAIMRCANQGK
jgi:hypothetical protein